MDRIRKAVMLFLLVILVSCAAEKNYRKAVSINSIESYTKYQRKYPKKHSEN